MKKYDVVIIGSGPGGYVSAIRSAQLGMKTALIERYPTLGGTCLNVGCIPSKAWLDSSERFFSTLHSHLDHGIEVNDVKLNLEKMRKRVEKVVKDNSQGVNFLMKKNKVDTYHGHGSFISRNEIKISSSSEESVIYGKNIVIATGSKPSSLPNVSIDKKRIITSTEALFPTELPKKLLVIGGGIIGLEMGSVYKRLGSDVTVVEYADRILSSMDRDISKVLKKTLEAEGVKFLTSHAVKSVTSDSKGIKLKAADSKGDDIELDGDYCLVAVGRSPYTQNLGLENIDLDLDERGRIPVDDNLQTSIKGIYAIGDVVRGAMLAHKAEEEGVFVAEYINGQKPHINHLLIPSVVYTWPEAASVGYLADELKEKGVNFKQGVFPFKASGRARASNEFEGFIKVLADEKSDEILGVHMIGPRCADLITQAVVAMEYRASAEDIARVCHPHPTYSEAIKEACLAATENRALHI